MEIKVNINEESFKEAIGKEIANIIEETVSNEIENNVGDLIEKTLEEKLSDIESYVDMQDLSDKVQDNIDIDHIFDLVNDRLDLHDLARDLRDYIDIDFDAASEANDLLSSYTPGNGCSLGNAFTEAIRDGVVYLLQSDSLFVDKLKHAMISYNDKDALVENYLNNHMEYQQFLREKRRAEAERKAAEEALKNQQQTQQYSQFNSTATIQHNQQSA